MFEIKHKSIEDFWSEFSRKVSNRTIIVTDIDGVWFDGLVDWREWLGIFKKSRLDLISDISSKTNILFFTNRGNLGAWKGGYVDGLKQALGNNLIVWESSKTFVKENPKVFKKALIKHANKPGVDSFKVLEKLSEYFDKIYYVAGQDFFFVYSDRELMNKVQNIGSNLLKSKITFVNITK